MTADFSFQIGGWWEKWSSLRRRYRLTHKPRIVALSRKRNACQSLGLQLVSKIKHFKAERAIRACPQEEEWLSCWTKKSVTDEKEQEATAVWIWWKYEEKGIWRLQALPNSIHFCHFRASPKAKSGTQLWCLKFSGYQKETSESDVFKYGPVARNRARWIGFFVAISGPNTKNALCLPRLAKPLKKATTW